MTEAAASDQSLEGRVAWASPSNIALIKYWGKHGVQLPRNPSVSLTLSQCATTTEIIYKPSAGDLSFDFEFEGRPHPAFEARVGTYLSAMTAEIPMLDRLHLSIRSSNSFPHSSGIASSASAFSALALCLCSIDHAINHNLSEDQTYRRKASRLARLGSGSAARSIYAHAALWGKSGTIEGSSDDYAVAVGQDIDKVFTTYRDAILIVDQGAKSTSSSAGHQLMNEHPYANERYNQARLHMSQIMEAMRTGDLKRFVELVEIEAMQLHAMMMCSRPYYLLLSPNSIKIINLIREFRKSTQIPVCFTIDAGPNIHLLYPAEDQAPVQVFIKDVLVPYCQAGMWIDDFVGLGPQQQE